MRPETLARRVGSALKFLLIILISYVKHFELSGWFQGPDILAGRQGEPQVSDELSLAGSPHGHQPGDDAGGEDAMEEVFTGWGQVLEII